MARGRAFLLVVLNIWFSLQYIGPGSSFSIATDYGLDGPGSNPGGRDIPPVQTGPGAHPGSYRMGTGSFPGVGTTGTWG